MFRILELISLTTAQRLLPLCAAILALSGCAMKSAVRSDYDDYQPSPQLVAHDGKNAFSVAREDGVIGHLGLIRLAEGDTLPDIARHFGLGLTAISAANPGIDLWVPQAGERIMLPLQYILPDAPRAGIVINLAAMRLFQFTGTGEPLTVTTYPVGVGSDERPSPRGQMRVLRKTSRPTWHVPASIATDHLKKGDPLPATVLPGPLNPLGEYALYLSAPSYLIHGTNKPASIGLRATNGCIRLYPEDVKKLYENTPVKTPVTIVEQPYLLGQANGMLYLEVHVPLEKPDAAEFDKMYAQLTTIEKESGRTLDWSTVKRVLAEARGIPVPIFAVRPESGSVADPVEFRHPDELRGRLAIPALPAAAWSVLAAEMRDEREATRLAAIINHQGPPIPTRVLAQHDRYRVVAGPFADSRAAQAAIKRLKIDLELDGSLIEPITKR